MIDNAEGKVLTEEHNATETSKKGEKKKRKKESPKPRCIGAVSMQEEVLSEDVKYTGIHKQ